MSVINVAAHATALLIESRSGGADSDSSGDTQRNKGIRDVVSEGIWDSQSVGPQKLSYEFLILPNKVGKADDAADSSLTVLG